jgi:hypothetical protein
LFDYTRCIRPLPRPTRLGTRSPAPSTASSRSTSASAARRLLLYGRFSTPCAGRSSPRTPTPPNRLR